MRSLQLAKSHPAPSGAPISVSRSSSGTAGHARTSSASVCSSTLVPPSALRKGKYDTSCGHSVTQAVGPSINLSIIHSTYGKNANLYNILRIKPSADSNAIRRAYLKQGRKTLLDHGMARKNAGGVCQFVSPEAVPKKLEDVPPEARKKFQAISIAYEILSTPELKRAYDAKDAAKKQPIDLKRVTSGNSVRWKSFVEEKIIEDADPDEHSHRRRASDDGWLHSHLEKLDQEAEMFLNGDFLDELDESITSMSESLSESIGSLMKRGMGGSHATASQDYNSRSQPGRSQATHPCNLINQTYQTTSSKQKHKSLRNSVNIQTQFSEEIKERLPVKQAPSLESPCSVMAIQEFVSEIADEAASMLANSFSNLLDSTAENKVENSKLTDVTPRSADIRALERERFNEQLREGFGEPFYCPSPQR